MTKEIGQELDKVVKKIVKEFKPEKIILFGSYAWGKPTKDSDVDLFIVKETSRSTRDIAPHIRRSLFPAPFPLDLIVYTPKDVAKSRIIDDFFIEDILVNGRILYG